MDAATLTVVHTLVNGVFVAALFYAWKVTVRLPGTGFWAIGFSGIGIGQVLYAAYVGGAGMPFAAVGYIAEIVGLVLIVQGCGEFTGYRTGLLIDVSIASFGILGSMVFTSFLPNPIYRLLCGNAAFSVLFIRAAIIFFRRPSPALRPTIYFISICFAAIGITEFAQAAFIFISGNPALYLSTKSYFLILYSFGYSGLGMTLLQIGYSRFQSELDEKAKESTLLLKEMHHRTKNNLVLVGSLVALEAGELSDGNALAAFKRVESRIRTIAKLHELLQNDGGVRIVRSDDYLSHVLKLLPVPEADVLHRVEIIQQVDPIELEISTAIPLGLIVNELATNVFKHAFPGDRRGTLRVRFGCSADRLELVVEDDGVGFTQKNEADSLGMTLVRELAGQLRGNLHIGGDTGTRVGISFPATNLASC